MRPLAQVGAALAFVLAILGLTPPAHAVDVTCPDGVVVQAEATPSGFDYTIVCAGHMTPGSTPTDNPTAGPEDSGATPAAGTWVYDGPVCDNAGICASNLLCSDGTPMVRYVFVATDGTRGDVRIICPDQAVDPDPTVVPPTPGEIFTAFEKVVPTTSALAVQPPDGQTLVNFETVFSTVADPFTTPEIDLLPGFKVVFEVAPTAFTWTFGDGTTLTTDSPGRPWSKGADVSTLINHVYTSTNDVAASVTTTWGARARLNGGPPTPVDGTVDVTSPDVALEVLEATPELVE